MKRIVLCGSRTFKDYIIQIGYKLIEEGYEKVYSMVIAVHVGRRFGRGARDGREGSGCKGDKVRREGSQYCIRQDNPGFGNLFGRRSDREMYVYVYQ